MVNAHGTGEHRSVLVLGASGMLGHALMHELSSAPGLTVHGTVRSTGGLPAAFTRIMGPRLVAGVDVRDRQAVTELVERLRPDVVVNAVGVIKQTPNVDDTVLTAELNGLLPHLLARLCTDVGARLVQISTDCVFSGRTGGYTEDDIPDPIDFYGRSKLLGEVGEPHITLRTSIIGPELREHLSLLEWFLSQSGKSIKGFTRAIYSGVPTVELARVIRDLVLPRGDLSGLWHVASEPVSKADLLELIGREYDWAGEITPDDSVRIDRSMSASKLSEATGYVAPPWPSLIHDMHAAQTRWRTT